MGRSEVAARILPILAEWGRALDRSAPASLYRSDPNRAAQRHMVLGAARRAYKEIRNGYPDPLLLLELVIERAEIWWVPFDALESLADRLAFETTFWADDPEYLGFGIACGQDSPIAAPTGSDFQPGLF